jgi:hypothetical protein
VGPTVNMDSLGKRLLTSAGFEPHFLDHPVGNVVLRDTLDTM